MSNSGLEQLAKLSGTSADRLEELLSLIKAPDSLTHLALVMSNLQRALNAIQEIQGLQESLKEGGEEERKASLLNYLPLISQLVTSVKASDAYSCPDEWLDQTGKQRGIINEHPEWAMLILTPGSKCYERGSYWQHAGVVMACSAIQRRRHQERIGSEITAACRDIRTIGQGKKPLSLLEQVDTDTNLESYYQKHLLEGDEVCESLAGIDSAQRVYILKKPKNCAPFPFRRAKRHPRWALILGICLGARKAEFSISASLISAFPIVMRV